MDNKQLLIDLMVFRYLNDTEGYAPDYVAKLDDAFDTVARAILAEIVADREEVPEGGSVTAIRV